MIIVEDGATRRLVAGATVIDGGSNRAGLYACGDNLYFDGAVISTSQAKVSGFVAVDDKIYFNGTEITGGETPPIAEYWTPPTQAASTYITKDYAGYIADYDALMAQHPNYITKHRYEKNGVAVTTVNGGFELFSYWLTPENYSKTIFIQAGIHGNEMDAKQQLLRFVDILCNETTQPAYSALAPLRNDVRFIIIPIVSPYGHNSHGMNVPYPNTEYGINMNRNYDANHQYALPSGGVGGNYPFEMVETQHTRDLVAEIGAENIDYFQDWHDGGNVNEHYWLNYSVDGDNRQLVTDFVNYLIDKYQITNPVIHNCRDVSTTGTTQQWGGKTMGMMSSTVEWIGGLLGYSFNESQMTQSMEIRANMVLMAYKNDIKGWQINEPDEATYFHFDYPRAFTRKDLRLDGATSETIVTDEMIYARWDALQLANSSYISKSAQLGYNRSGILPIHTYTLGNGANKVLYVGGIMRYGGQHKIDEYAMYLLAEYLCNPYVVNQSAFLTDLKNNYTIIVLPFIDNVARNTADDKNAGLNNTVITQPKWQIVNDKTEPTTFALSVHDVPILLSIIDSNQDLKCIVSGGEIMTGYSLNPPDYTTSFETHFVIPRKMVNDLATYKTHLETDRDEFVVVENTQGKTFGDYAYDQYGIPTYFVQLKVSKKFTELAEFHSLTSEQYLHSNYEAGRRIANIVNLFLM